MNESAATAEGASPAKMNGAHPVAGKRREFTADFKHTVVTRVKKGGETAGAVASKLKISPSVVRRWVQQDVPKGSRPKTAKGSTAIKGVTKSPSGRKVYSEAFQRAAVARLLKGEAAQLIADDLEIHNSMLYNWRDKLAGKKAKTRSDRRDRRYTDEFKRAAVARVHGGESAEAVRKELGVSSSGMYYWVHSKKLKGAKASAPGVAPAGKGATAGNLAASAALRDAITYLKHVKTDMYALLQSGSIKEFEEYHLNTLAALRRLQSIPPS